MYSKAVETDRIVEQFSQVVQIKKYSVRKLIVLILLELQKPKIILYAYLQYNPVGS